MDMIRSQVRHNNVGYDILGRIVLGNYEYVIIGRSDDNKYIDVTYKVRVSNSDKIEYVSPTFDSADVNLLQGQYLLDIVVNEVKDFINANKLNSKEEIIDYIESSIKLISNSPDIKKIFDGSLNSNDLESSYNLLSSYYSELRKGEPVMTSATFSEDDEILIIPDSVSDVSDAVDEAYDKVQSDLDYTGRYVFEGLPFASTDNYAKEEVKDKETHSENKISESANKDVVSKDETISENDLRSSLDFSSSDTSVISSDEVTTKEKDEDTIFGNFTYSDIEFALSNKRDKLTSEQIAYLENKLAMSKKNDEVGNVSLGVNNGKQMVKSNGKSLLDNAAYVSITTLLYIVGSLELFIAIILLAKI